MQKRIDHLSGHYIVCGVGSTGTYVVEELINTHHAFVVIDRDEERLIQFTDRFGPPRFHYVAGDATADGIREMTQLRGGIASGELGRL